MIALGLLLLVVAAVVALVGIFTNLGSSHQLGRTVDLLGYHLHGSTGCRHAWPEHAAGRDRTRLQPVDQ
jgi:hypothetical protein